MCHVKKAKVQLFFKCTHLVYFEYVSSDNSNFRTAHCFHSVVHVCPSLAPVSSGFSSTDINSTVWAEKNGEGGFNLLRLSQASTQRSKAAATMAFKMRMAERKECRRPSEREGPLGSMVVLLMAGVGFGLVLSLGWWLSAPVMLFGMIVALASALRSPSSWTSQEALEKVRCWQFFLVPLGTASRFVLSPSSCRLSYQSDGVLVKFSKCKSTKLFDTFILESVMTVMHHPVL